MSESARDRFIFYQATDLSKLLSKIGRIEISKYKTELKLSNMNKHELFNENV